MKQLFFILAWFFIVTGVLITTVSAAKLANSRVLMASADAERVSQVLGAQTVINPETVQPVESRVVYEVADSRPMLVKSFIERYNKRLLEVDPDFHKNLVAIADRHGIDFRLLPAIAMKESGMCRAIPEDSFNCLGLGVHSKGTWMFDSYEANFDKAAEILKKNYIDRGLVTPEQIMTKYTPSSPNGEWARGVNQFMSEMRFNNRQKGVEEENENNVLEFVSMKMATSPASIQISIAP